MTITQLTFCTSPPIITRCAAALSWVAYDFTSSTIFTVSFACSCNKDIKFSSNSILNDGLFFVTITKFLLFLAYLHVSHLFPWKVGGQIQVALPDFISQWLSLRQSILSQRAEIRNCLHISHNFKTTWYLTPDSIKILQISQKSPEYPAWQSHVAFPLEIKHFPPNRHSTSSHIAKRCHN